MGIENIAGGALNMTKKVVKTPATVAERVGDYGLNIFTQTLEIFAPRHTQTEFVEALKRQEPISEANCALRALHAADKARYSARRIASYRSAAAADVKEVVEHKMEEAKTLSNIGHAMLKKTIVRAHNNDDIPDHVTKELVFTALEVGTDPTIKGYLDAEQVQPVIEVFDEFNNVTQLPNRL